MKEEDVITGCKKNDPKCQRLLFDRYAGILMTICLRYARDQHEAEDILQEAFVRIFANIGQFNFLGSFEGWLKRITVNAALKVIQKTKIHFAEINDDHSGIHMDALSNLCADELLKLIMNLPDGYRIVFNLFAMEGYSHNEISEMLNIKIATSRSQLSKARNLLKTQISLLAKITI